MRLLISLILVLTCLYATPLIGQRAIREKPIIDRQGHILGKREGKTQAPKEIVDTVRLTSGVAVFPLNQFFQKDRKRSAPTDKYQIWPTVTQIVEDTSVTICTYAIMTNSRGDTLTIRSSSDDDSSLVVVRAIIR